MKEHLYWMIPGILIGMSTVLWLLRRFPNSAAGRVAFWWIGPKAREVELWSHYQLRWAAYSLGWLALSVLAFASVVFLDRLSPGLASHPLSRAFSFLAFFGAGMSFVASIVFLARAVKAKWLGPNPQWKPSVDV